MLEPRLRHVKGGISGVYNVEAYEVRSALR